jgi:hypothetical protein
MGAMESPNEITYWFSIPVISVFLKELQSFFDYWGEVLHSTLLVGLNISRESHDNSVKH